MPKNRCAVYVRLSNQHEDDESIARQVKLCSDYARAHAWDITLYQEPAGSRSGFYESNRPAWKQLKKDLAASDDFAAVIVAELSRASRRVTTLLEFVESLTARHIEFVSIREQIDPNTAMGRMFIGISAVLNQWERDNTSERKQIQVKARDKRIYASNVHPFGITRTGKYPAIQWATTADFPTVLLLAELYTSGYSCRDIAKELNARGLTWISRKRERVRISPYTLDTCLGAFERYKPFVDDALYNAVITRRTQQATKTSQARRYKNPPLLLSHLLYCDLCGTLLICTTNRIPTKTGIRIVRRYLHRNIECVIGNRNYRTEPIEAQFFEQVESLCNLTPEEKDAYARELADPPRHVQLDHRLKRDKLTQRLQEYDLMRADREISKERFAQVKAEIDAQLAELPDPAPAPVRVVTYEMAYAFFDSFAAKVAELHTLLPYEANRLARSLVDKVRISGDGKVIVELAGSSQTLEKT